SKGGAFINGALPSGEKGKGVEGLNNCHSTGKCRDTLLTLGESAEKFFKNVLNILVNRGEDTNRKEEGADTCRHAHH
ncbi:hypothetical protein DRN85_07745, partial [Methanosarcinales archaeon]